MAQIKPGLRANSAAVEQVRQSTSRSPKLIVKLGRFNQRLWWCSACLSVAAVTISLTGCSADPPAHATPEPATTLNTAPRTTLDASALDGPLIWKDEDPTTAWARGIPGRFVYEFGIDLRNESDKPITLDRVRIQPSPGVVNVKFKSVGIAGPHRNLASAPPDMLNVPLRPVHGYVVHPEKSYRYSDGQFPPLLLVEVGPGDARRSYNENVQVYYHDENGTPWVAIYPERYIFCLIGPGVRACMHDDPSDPTD